MSEYGPMYGSKASGFLSIARGPEPIYHPTSGKQIGVEKEVTADFAVHGGTSMVPGPEGTPVEVADIHGHFFDIDQAALRLRWSDEEKEMMRAKLDWDCERMPEHVWHIEPALAVAPWPTYDDTPREKIVETAIMLGLVEETLAYEPQNANRSTVTGPLRKHVERLAEEQAAESALTAA